MARCEATLASRHDEAAGAARFPRLPAGTARVLGLVMFLERRTREPTTEELRARLGYGGPKLDLMPEIAGVVANLLLLGVISWTLGWPF
jgi:hypothetical protein